MMLWNFFIDLFIYVFLTLLYSTADISIYYAVSIQVQDLLLQCKYEPTLTKNVTSVAKKQKEKCFELERIVCNACRTCYFSNFYDGDTVLNCLGSLSTITETTA